MGFHVNPVPCFGLEKAMCDEETPRWNVADMERLASRRLRELQESGATLRPVLKTSRALASHFWGKAWMRHLAYCESEGLCLAPGRSLLRHGCVLDLQLAPGEINALVSAESLFDVHLTLPPMEEARMEGLRQACCGCIDSLVSLLEGRTDASVLERLCEPEMGLLPLPGDWRMSCTCPDWSEPCPHEAAAIYAAGTLIDEDPSLLFLLRMVETSSLVSAPELSPDGNYDVAALGAMFDIDLETSVGR